MARVTQKDKIAQFISLTNTSEKEAKKILTDHEWDVNRAVNSFFSSTNHIDKSSQLDMKQLESLFEAYVDDGQRILVDGTEKLCEDLGVDVVDIVVLVLAWHLKCESPCEFTKEGWIRGWSELGCDSIEKMREEIPRFREELQDKEIFKKIYKWTFDFIRSDAQKVIDMEIAIGYWQLLLPSYEYLEKWCEFLREKHNGRGVSKDTWNLFYEFVENVGSDFGAYDMDGAWPVLIDEFVDYLKSK